MTIYSLISLSPAVNWICKTIIVYLTYYHLFFCRNTNVFDYGGFLRNKYVYIYINLYKYIFLCMYIRIYIERNGWLGKGRGRNGEEGRGRKAFVAKCI